MAGHNLELHLMDNRQAQKKHLERKVNAMTAGVPPPSAILEKIESLGFEVMHVRGLTETYGYVALRYEHNLLYV